VHNFEGKHWENIILVTLALNGCFIMLFGVKLSHESGAHSIGTAARGPTFTNDWAKKQESDQTVLTITIALTKTTNYTRRP